MIEEFFANPFFFLNKVEEILMARMEPFIDNASGIENQVLLLFLVYSGVFLILFLSLGH